MKRLLIFSFLLAGLFLASSPVRALTASDYQSKGLLPYKEKPYFILGELDRLGRPTWAHIQFHPFIDAKADKNYKDPDKPINGESGKRTDYLPGFQGNDDKYLIPPELNRGYIQKAWSPRSLLSTLWTDSGTANRAQNFGLITTYADEGFARNKPKGLTTLRDYERALDDWISSASREKGNKKAYLVDYKIELIYQGDELVPRQIQIRYIGLTKDGKLKKIDLEGEESFDTNGIASVVIENTAPHVTIDYLTGKVTGQVYVPVQASSASSDTEEDDSLDEEVYVNWDTGYYYYDVDDVTDYDIMTERDAIADGYVWDSLE